MNIEFINDVLSLVFVAITLAAIIGPMLFALYETPVARWIMRQKQEKKKFFALRSTRSQAPGFYDPLEPPANQRDSRFD